MVNPINTSLSLSLSLIIQNAIGSKVLTSHIAPPVPALAACSQGDPVTWPLHCLILHMSMHFHPELPGDNTFSYLVD